MFKSEHQIAVEQFMTRAGQNVPLEPCMPDSTTRVLRAILIAEEALECIKALLSGEDLHDIVKELCDLSVVTTGALSACGVSDLDVLKEVDKSNMTKFGPGYDYDAAGKLLKSPSYVKPDLASILGKVTTR